MRDAGHLKPVLLADYQPPAFLIDDTRLDFDLAANRTRVTARLHLTRNTAHPDANASCWLDGVDITLNRLAIDGNELTADRYQQTDNGLLIHEVPDDFVLETDVTIDPEANTALEGLYMSHGMFTTQCEAQGFRHITFFPDRPDVLSCFTVTVRGDKKGYPLLLSNGNPIDQGEDGARHWVTWQDPHPKPCYLFALVAGDLACLQDQFTTMSGRQVTLKIFAEQKDLDKLGHAMTSLKNAMAWDEKTFGREYDLDLFMIVAVSHFNMGAMENKGLNIFNTSCVLAHPDTTTDAGFLRVESVVAHEYFHNWSGNRVTCRDWFQLSLKEGFTVFREHEFASDMNSRHVKRVEDVGLLYSHQFPEDQGPMAHPVRPESYQKIDNFYTITVYEKGAEVVRMQAELLGDKFRQATDDYFARFDGQAVTCDDFVDCMERALGDDMRQFRRWYSTAGTPQLSVSAEYHEGNYSLTIKQQIPDTANQTDKAPLMIPIATSLIGENGPLALDENGDTETVLVLTEPEQTFTFSLNEAPVPSLLRGFSAPVQVHYGFSEADLTRLLTQDTDGFVRWDAAQRLYTAAIERLMTTPDNLAAEVETLAPVMQSLLADSNQDPATTALLLSLPAETVIGDRQPVWEPEKVHSARASLRQGLAAALESTLWQAVEANATAGQYQPVSADIAKRSLRWCALGYLASIASDKVTDHLHQVFANADNMTDELNALRLLVHGNLSGADKALSEFAERWKAEDLVMDKWFGIQTTRPDTNALADAEKLAKDSRFDIKSPNRVRALMGSFAAGNPVAFHQPDGAGYAFYFDLLAKLDKVNPQVAARMGGVASRLPRLPEARAKLLAEQLQQLIDGGCSDNLAEVLGRILQSRK